MTVALASALVESACRCCTTAAPLFVRLPDGDLRNGYTVKIVNKSQSSALFELRTDGLNGASLAEAKRGWDRQPARAAGQGRQRRHVPRHVTGAAAAAGRWLAGIDFIVRNDRDRRADRYHSVFMGPD